MEQSKTKFGTSSNVVPDGNAKWGSSLISFFSTIRIKVIIAISITSLMSLGALFYFLIKRLKIS